MQKKKTPTGGGGGFPFGSTSGNFSASGNHVYCFSVCFFGAQCYLAIWGIKKNLNHHLPTLLLSRAGGPFFSVLLFSHTSNSSRIFYSNDSANTFNMSFLSDNRASLLANLSFTFLIFISVLLGRGNCG